MKLERFTNFFYGDYKCCNCENALIGHQNVIGEEEDDEGFQWRAFCDECFKELKNKSNEELYNNFKTNETID